MKRNSEQRIDRLFDLLRHASLDHSRLEFGFETRLFCRLKEEETQAPSFLAWKLMPFFSCGILLLTVVLYFQFSSTQLVSQNLLASSTSDLYEEMIPNP